MDARMRKAMERAVAGSGRAALEGVRVGQRREHVSHPGVMVEVVRVDETRTEVEVVGADGRTHVWRAVEFAREWRVR